MKLKGAEFNQQMQNLIGKYPYIKKEWNMILLRTIIKTADNVNRYSWNLQIPTNDTMKNTRNQDDVLL